MIPVLLEFDSPISEQGKEMTNLWDIDRQFSF